ncbi:MAG: protein-L-isoaspartate O-methyltransferase [bacterium]
MNKEQLLNKLLKYSFDNKIINAFDIVKRESFVTDKYRDMAYEDTALPLCNGQTISQPYTIAFMLNLLELKNEQKILEVGSGSGYVLALISKIVKAEIYGTERIKELAEQSRINLNNNIKIIHTPDSLGLPGYLFDRILVSAAANKLPDELIKQLADNGILVIPIQDSIVKVEKKKTKIIKQEFYGFSFVPLIY